VAPGTLPRHVIIVQMASVLERKLIVVTGKGGVGKTTVSAAVGLLAASRGLRTIVVEVTGTTPTAGTNGTGGLPALFGRSQAPPHGEEVELRERLWSLSIDRDRVLAEWLRALGGRVSARVLTSSSAFQYLIAAAPGAREMLSLVKVWELAAGRHPRGRGEDYDLVVLDAPATGHALGMLSAPKIFSGIARVGPVARQSEQVREFLEDPERCAYLAVAQPTEMAVTETLQLRKELRHELGRELHAVVVNGALPRRFGSGELQLIAALNGGRRGAEKSVTSSAARAAQTVQARARAQQRQIARLRRVVRSHGSPPVLGLPFIFHSELDLEAIQRLADRLERSL
jgi:anion-transporting  ArsA/GET3 family ATPase